jgi:hypothetical protein
VGTFAARFEERLRAHLEIPCKIVAIPEDNSQGQLGDVAVIVSMSFTSAMGGRRHSATIAVG